MKELIFKITNNAANRINFLKKAEEEGSMLRIKVNGGGCSGFKYDYEFVTKTNQDDHVFENNGAKVIIDDLSISSFMNGSELDYIEDLTSASFEIKNPNSKLNCGCGNSFSI